MNHPDLAANLWQNPGEINNNGIDDDGNGLIDDFNGWDSSITTRILPQTAPARQPTRTVRQWPGWRRAWGTTASASPASPSTPNCAHQTVQQHDHASRRRQHRQLDAVQNQNIDIYNNSWGPASSTVTSCGPADSRRLHHGCHHRPRREGQHHRAAWPGMTASAWAKSISHAA